MMMKKMCAVHKAAWVLVLVGALNWGLVGAAQVNLVQKLLGSMGWLERTVYVLVGLAGLSMLGLGKCCMKGGMCKDCGKEGCDCGKPAEAPKMEQKM